MMSARSQRKAGMSGDKYVDALRRMGVEPDWRIQQAPEFLGRHDIDVRPAKTFATAASTGVAIGDSVARYEGTLEKRLGRKMFAEHGYIVGVFVMRPHLFNDQLDNPPDGQAQTIEDFYLADNLRSVDEYNERLVSIATTDSAYAERFAYLRNGIHMYGSGKTWLNTFAPDDLQEAVFVDSADVPTGDQLGANQVAVHATLHSKGVTPVPPNSF
jgi:hypothetical protein